MIVRCPSCHRGYRLDDRLSTGGRPLRCSVCKHKFTLGAPARGEAAPAVPPRKEPEAPPKAEPLHERGDGKRIVLADAGRPFRGVVTPLLDELGCHVDLATDGMDAFRLAVSTRPDLLIASVHLPGLSGVAICEGVKGSPHLRSIKVALVGSTLTSDLFNRETARAYGADLFLEEEMGAEPLRRDLANLLRAADAPGGGPPRSEARETGPDPGDPTAGPDAEIGALARLMLSDLRLYYADRYERAIRDGKLFEIFSDELTKGRAMLDERYPQVADRHKILAAALRAGIEGGAGEGPSSSGTRTG